MTQKAFFFSPKTEAYTYSYRFNILVSLDSGDLIQSGCEKFSSYT